MATEEEMQRYYERDRERDRLADGLGELEFLRTIELINRTLPDAPAVLADIGGGPGRYTDWYVEQGYTVIHRDIVLHHVDQVRERYGSAVDTAVGDARDLSDIETASVDATLLLGPLYHLPELADRTAVLQEASRITRPGGMIYAACIGRWSARIQGMLVDRLYLETPETTTSIDLVDETGVLEPIIDGGFTGYTHTPDQLSTEMQVEGLELQTVLAVEGIASAFSGNDVSARLADPTDRTVLLDSLRALEAVPDLLGASSHLLAIAHRR